MLIITAITVTEVDFLEDGTKWHDDVNIMGLE